MGTQMACGLSTNKRPRRWGLTAKTAYASPAARLQHARGSEKPGLNCLADKAPAAGVHGSRLHTSSLRASPGASLIHTMYRLPPPALAPKQAETQRSAKR